MTAKHNGEFWFLANIYGPCSHDGKRDFLRWFKHYNITDTENWLLVGDFNLLRKPENRNRAGVTSMRCYSLMMQSTILAWLSYHSMVEDSLGQTNKNLHWWKDLIGSLPQALGPCSILIPQSAHSSCRPQITGPVTSPSHQTFRMGKFSGLRIIGCSIQVSCRQPSQDGMTPAINLIVQRLSLQNAKI